MRFIKFVVLVFSVVLSLTTPVRAFDIQHGVQWLRDKQILSFKRTFAASPVVLTSAQQKGNALTSCATSISSGSFKLLLRDKDGRPTRGWVHWIAIAPDANQAVIGKAQQLKDRAKVKFPKALPDTPVVIVNAEGGGNVYRAAAISNSKTGFSVVLNDHDGKAVSKKVSVQWIAVVPGRGNLFQGQSSQNGDGKTIALPSPQERPSTVIVSAQTGNKGVAASASYYGDADFVLALHDENGAPVTNASTQWLAYAERNITASTSSSGATSSSAANSSAGSNNTDEFSEDENGNPIGVSEDNSYVGRGGACAYCGDWTKKVANGGNPLPPSWSGSDFVYFCNVDAYLEFATFIDCACQHCASCTDSRLCSGSQTNPSNACWTCVGQNGLATNCKAEFNTCASDTR
jgi:hypothetical protein